MNIKIKLVLVFTLFLILSCSSQEDNSKVYAQNGFFDFSHFSDPCLEQTSIIALDGEWQILEKELFSPEEFDKGEQTPQVISVPSVWEKTLSKDVNYVTMRLNLIGLKKGESFTLFIPQISTAYRLWINNKEYPGNGIVGTSRESSSPQFSPQYSTFVAQKNINKITLQISNFHYRKSGVWRKIYIGSVPTISRFKTNSFSIDFLIFTILIIFAIYHLGINYYSKENGAELYFGIICIILSLRVLCTDNQFLTLLIPHFPWGLARRLEFLPFYLLGIFITLYIDDLFSSSFNKRFKRFYLILFSIFSFIFILLPIQWSNYFVIPGEVALFSLLLYCLYALFIALRKKEKNALSLFIAISILCMTCVNDVLFANQIIQTIYMSHIGVIFFMAIQSKMLTQRFISLLHKTNQLEILMMTDDLTQLNNRQGFFTKAKECLNSSLNYQKPVTFLYFDLNGLKKINDNHGHKMGDIAIRSIAKLLKEHYKGSDIFARIGGDEFVGLLMDCTNQDALIAIQKFNNKIADFNKISQLPFELSISIGLSSCLITKNTSLEEMILEADKNMYTTKKAYYRSKSFILKTIKF